MSDDKALGKQIAKQHFIALVKEAQGVKSELSSISGDFGERLKAAQENANLNLKAFRFICAMDRMDELKRDALWDQLQLYHDFAQAERWGGSHVGDLDKMARAASSDEGEGSEDSEQRRVSVILENGDTVETTADAAAAMDESVRNAGRIQELPAEQHEANQKGRRGRAKDAAEKAQAREDRIEAAAERGRIDWADRKPGKIPADLEGKPAEANAWLQAWEAGQIAASKARDDADFERNPPKREALPGADAPGSYELTH